MSLIECDHLTKRFPISRLTLLSKTQFVHAVKNVTFDIQRGETIGLVGESGCGKSTLGRLLLGLLTPSSGQVTFLGKDIFKLSRSEKQHLRAKIQIIFQDPFASLNPRKTVRQILGKPFKIHTKSNSPEIETATMALMEAVGLSPAHIYMDRYPHEFSGGQQQRIGIARALALKPNFVVADEAVSSLDLSERTQILKLLKELQREFQLTYLFITHDLAVVRKICSRVAVMYLGKLVEVAPVAALFDKQLHPYTQALLSAAPLPDPRATRARKKIVLETDIPSPVSPLTGCQFRTRCHKRFALCERIEPQLAKVQNNHQVACHLYR